MSDFMSNFAPQIAYGVLLEWLKRIAWNAVNRHKRFGGSNPSHSAKDRGFSSVFCYIHGCRQANNGSPKGGQFALIHPLWVGRIAENVGLRRSGGRNADACPCESG